jgi:hypothetical protein
MSRGSAETGEPALAVGHIEAGGDDDEGADDRPAVRQVAEDEIAEGGGADQLPAVPTTTM